MNNRFDDFEAQTAARRPSPTEEEVCAWLVAQLSAHLRIRPEEIDTGESFASYGLPSKEAVGLSGLIQDWLGRRVSPTVFWEYPTIETLARHLIDDRADPESPYLPERETHTEPLAIIGLACRFPRADGPTAFWQLLSEGADAITEVPADRWEVDRFYDPDPEVPGTSNTRWGGFLEQIDRFDPGFFGISPREAARMDPQQRLLLEVAWEALEEAGQDVERLAGSRTGVFVGISTNEYSRRQFSHPELIDAYAGTGNALSIAANRISHLFDLRGPSMAIDTACSSSLVAVHLACCSLWSGEATLALAGGVNLILSPEISINFTKAGVMAADGRCKAFDARANGYVRGEGAGIVVLKRLSHALADGDPIAAVILGSAVNNDGRTNGLMAPSRQAQEAVLREAYRRAGVSPGLVEYVEAHGTGTLLGDPIEAKALATVLGVDRAPDNRCAIGSVKTNFGHLEAAAGIAGLIKIALSLKHRAIPPSLHFDNPNPLIPFRDIALRVQQRLTEWPSAVGERLAGVSSFGFGGTNAHVVVREAPPIGGERDDRGESAGHVQLLPLSARSADSLRSMARAYCEFFAKDTPDARPPLADVCYTAAARRSHHDYRLAVTGHSASELTEKLEAFLRDETRAGLSCGRAGPRARRKVAFVFPGQGSQWTGMGRQLLAHEPVFRAAIDDCDRALREYLDWSLLRQLTEPDRFNEIDVVQPTLFGVQVALAAVWRSWGIEPDAVVGHSMGEVAAAHVAGALTLQDAARIICERSRLLRSVCGQGGMAAVDLPLDAARQAVAAYRERLSIAVENSPTSTVLSGEMSALEDLIGTLQQQEVFCRFVNVDVASHSPQMDPLLDELRVRLGGVSARVAAVPIYSTVTGIASNGSEFDGAYWARNLREPVLFSTVIQQLLLDDFGAFLEVSPHPILAGAIQQGIRLSGREAVALPSLRRDEDERAAMLGTLGAVYARGHSVAWKQLFPRGARCVSLPFYPWQRERFWLDVNQRPALLSSASPPDPPQNARRRSPLLGRYLKSADDPKRHFWELDLSTERFPYVKDHRIRDQVVLPGTAYLDMAVSAANDALGTGFVPVNIELTDFLVLPEQTARTIQVVVSEDTAAESSFRVYSRPSGEDRRSHAWTLHAKGRLRRDEAGNDAFSRETVNLDHLRSACSEDIPGERYYEDLRTVGLHYGACFQGIERVWRGTGEALGLIRVPAPLETELDGYLLHPAVLDAALQVVGSTLPGTSNDDNRDLYVPRCIGELRVLGRLPQRIWSHVRLHTGGAQQTGAVTADIRLLDEGGRLLADVRRLELARLEQGDRAVAAEGLEGCFYKLRWELKARVAQAQQSRRSIAPSRGLWIVFADGGGVSGRLKSLIERRGDMCVTVFPGATYDVAEGGVYRINPADPEDARELLRDIAGSANPPLRGLVHLWNLDAADPDSTAPATLASAQLLGCTSVLHLIQALAGSSHRLTPRLFLVTRRAQPVDGADARGVSVCQSPVWGLGRVVVHEQPELRCTNVDLGEADSAEVESLYDELISDEQDDRVALRNRTRHVARLVRLPAEEIVRRDQPDGPGHAVRAAHPFRLELSKVGVLDGMTAAPMTRRRPHAGEVEIEVNAAGLNFMDIMKTLGLVPAVTAEPMWAGAECAGTITALGDGVTGFHQGDEVIAIAPGSFASFAMTASELVVPRPQYLSAEEAATIPVAFLTAYYALHHLARIRPGERVLVHAAAGGVGFAAVQIARWKGAEVFATAGSPDKRRFLHDAGVEHVFDSRSLAFAEDIMTRTGGQGVDVVLNSLGGEFVDRSVALLRAYGRFLEIGKRDIHQNRSLQLRPFGRSLSFFAIDLQQLCAERPALVGRYFRRLMRRFDDRTLTPLPFRTFPVGEVAGAMRHMAQARHTGKIVLSVRELGPPIAPAVKPSLPLRPDASYLITGGLGGIGLTVARWMVERGARHLVLMGRRGPSAEVEETLSTLRQAGASIVVATADVADREQVAALLADVASRLPPLRGIVHAAGVLDDGVLVQLDRERFEAVCRPKIAGAWNLHTLTLDTSLDFFVLFSSAASVFGSPGQGNYASANAFLDALAHHRRMTGLPALSINWGTWARVGLAVRPGRASRVAERGIDTISPEQGLEALTRLLHGCPPQVSVVRIDWNRVDRRATSVPLLAHFATPETRSESKGDGHERTAVRESILSAPMHSRHDILQSFVRDQLAKVLGLSPSKLDVHRPLNTLGVDSLMAIELRNRIEGTLGVTLPIATLLQGPDVLQLTDQLLDQMSDEGAASASPDGLPRIAPDPASRHLPFPLNDIQGAYWVGRNASLELGNVGSHFYLEFESGDLDVERLNDGWCALIARHDMLRAVVGEDGRQQILAAVPAYRMAVLDLRAATAGAAAAAVAAVRERMAHQVYAPAAWPLFEVRATRLAAGRVRVHFSIDLLIADVWSLFLLFREWGALYEAPERPLARLTVSFRDYVLAEAALQETALYARAQAYWAARVATLPPGPELPLARQPGSLAAPRFVRRSSRLEPAVWAALQRRGRQAGLTPSMVLCAAFAEVLATWSKHAAFSLNVTLFHRLPLHAEVAALVGDFTSTVLLAVEAGGPASFAARAQQLQQQLWADLEHRYVSGVRVLRDLARHAGRGPGLAMPVVFTSTLGQEGGDTPAPTGWLGELVYGLSQTPQVWLDHQVGEDGAALVFNWDVVEALFPAGLVAAMFEAYCGYLMRLATEAGAWEEPTRGLVPAAQLRVRAAMNATTAPVPEDTLPALVAAQVRARPGALAVRAPGRQLSYAEVDRAARVVARGLRRHGAAPNRLVAVVMEPGWEQVVAVLGVGHAGAAYLPIEADVPAERLRALLAQGEVGVVLTQSWLLATRAWPAEVTRLAVDAWETWGDAPLEEGERPAPRSDALAYVIFTSGSTGVPKGVMVTHRAAVNTLVEVNRRWAVGPADRVLALSALSFDLSVYDIVGTLAAGGTVVLPEAAARRDPAHWLALLAGEGVTIWNSVPALMQLLIETAEARGVRLPETLRLVLLSGDWIPVSLPDRIRARAPGAEVISLGGATEAAIWSIYFPIAAVDPQWASIPYGRPLANQTWHVLHPTGAPCPEWVPGELYIGGSGLAAGYWRDPETTRARFLAHPQSGERLYRTGDWGRYLPDGQLEFLGRADLQVKVQGYRIELGEIETALAQHPGVDRAVVAAVGDRAGDKRLVAYVVPRGTPPPAAAVRAFLRETLPDYLVPTTVVFLPTLPLTPNGKVDRNALRSIPPTEATDVGGSASPFALRASVDKSRHPPYVGTTPTSSAETPSLAAQIERLVARVLNVDRIDHDADLFSVGLTSIDMMRLANDLEKTFGFRPRIADLFRLSNVSAVASYYERLLRERRGAAHAADEAREQRPGSRHASEPLLLDPLQRQAFKQEQLRLRPLNGPWPVLTLPAPAADPNGTSQPIPDQRRSHRSFSADPVAFDQFAGLLGVLAQRTADGNPKHLYGSAGGLYPVQTYVHIRPGRMDNLSAGAYYYHPVEHGLLPLSRDVDLDRSVHTLINRPVFDRAAFSIFLVAQMGAITPIYGEKARDFALIEAGLMTQLLETSAARYHIGLCQVGLVDFEAMRDLFLLQESHLFLHALLGGRTEAERTESWPIGEETDRTGSSGNGWEEGTL